MSGWLDTYGYEESVERLLTSEVLGLTCLPNKFIVSTLSADA